MHRFVKIGEASKLLGRSVDTLRRWDKKERLTPDQKSKGGHRYYSMELLEQFAQELDKLDLVITWIKDQKGFEPLPIYYCPDSYVFQTRLKRFEEDLIRTEKFPLSYTSFLSAIVGEIGNNAYHHNIGRWPDVPGIFFSRNIEDQRVLLADRGLGVFKTLSKVIEMKDDSEALEIAFTKVISGRSPEKRGNGLKYTREIVENNRNLVLRFQSGNSMATIKNSLVVQETKKKIRGCLIEIAF